MCSETRPNAKPENVRCNKMKTLLTIKLIILSYLSIGQTVQIPSFPKGTTIKTFSASDFSKTLTEKPDVKNPSMTGMGMSGGCATTYGHDLKYKKTGIKISFIKYGDKDTFHLEYISVYKRTRYVTIDNVGAKTTIKLNDLGVTKDSYIETSIDNKKYGLIKKGNIKYYFIFQPKDKISEDSKLKVSFIEIYCT